jgi:hypothetical protein
MSPLMLPSTLMLANERRLPSITVLFEITVRSSSVAGISPIASAIALPNGELLIGDGSPVGNDVCPKGELTGEGSL